MRYCIALLLFILFFSCKKQDAVIALSENFLINGGGRSAELVRDMDIDAQGNIYVTGKITRDVESDTAWFDPLIIKTLSGENIVTVKYNKYGKAIWAKVTGSTGWDEGEAIAAGTDGNCYVAGVFGGTTLFGSTQLAPEPSFNSSGMPNLMDMFLTRYDGQGNVVWVRQIAGVGYERPTGIELDASGNIVVTGYFFQKINFSGTVITTNGSSFFIAKYSASGNLVWAKSYGNASFGSMYPDDLVVDVAGNIIIGGSFIGVQDFGGSSLQSSQQDNFVAKYDANGNMLWAKKLGGSGDDIGYSVALDEAGNTYFGGQFQSTITQDGFSIQSSGGLDGFWAKYNSTGQLQWLKSAGGTGEDGVKDLFVHKDTLYSIGYFIENFKIDGQVLPDGPAWNGFVTRHDLQGALGSVQVFSPGLGLPVKIEIDKTGYGIIGGYFSNTITIGNLSRISNGAKDLFLWKEKF
jgi:hypothetical protein